MQITGNKGEWSELYALLKIIDEKVIASADENLIRTDIEYPILEAQRDYLSGTTKYLLDYGEEKIGIKHPLSEIVYVETQNLRSRIKVLFDEINKAAIDFKGDGAFPVEGSADLLKEFEIEKLSAGSSEKGDLTLEIHDGRTARSHLVPYSIKSMLGGSSTLFNAGVFTYLVEGLSDEQIKEINAIGNPAKYKRRVSRITELGGSLKFVGADDTFIGNLRKIDSGLPEVIANLILKYYKPKGGKEISSLIALLEDEHRTFNGYVFSQEDIIFKIKNFLLNASLGMTVAKEWNGSFRANGGIIVVLTTGDLLCYQVYDMELYKSYLYKQTYIDTPSGSRHGFGEIKKEGDGKDYLKLGWQVRFLQ